LIVVTGSRDSSVGRVTRLRAGQSSNRGFTPGRGVRMCALRSARTGCWAHKTSCSEGTGGFDFRGE